MKIKAIVKLLSLLLLVQSLFMAIAAGIGLHYGESFHIIRAFLVPIGMSAGFFLVVFLVMRGSDHGYFSAKSGFMFVSLAWCAASGMGALPFVLSGALPSYTDAFFETMSGFTTTGASILSDIESLPRSLLFWRALTHWLGGMGIVVMTVALFPLLGLGGMQLVEAEAPGPTVDRISPRMEQTAKILWFIYLSLTVLQVILLLAGGLDLYDAVTHTFATLATGGFSTYNRSLGAFDSPYVHWVVTVFMMAAGMNFIMYYRLITGQMRSIFKDSEFRAYVGIFLVAALAITVSLYDRTYERFEDALRHAAFQTASILTTTGFATADFAAWPEFAQVVLFLLMFVGGCAGSTGGGMKVVRVVTMFKQALTEMKYLVFPRGVFSVRMSGTVVRKIMIFDIASFVYLYVLLLLAVMLVVATAGYDILTSFTAALATLGNIGPGFGRVGPAANFAHFPDYVKWVLSFAMMAGRLEIYTVLVLFTRSYWRR